MDANRSCTYFNNELFEKLNVQLRNYLHASGKKLPNLDSKLIESGPMMNPMLNPAQIKREHFEAVQVKREQFEAIQVKREQFEAFQANQQMVPDLSHQNQGSMKLINVTTKVIQQLGPDTCLVEELNGAWKCVVFIDHTVKSPGIMDLRGLFPMNSQVKVNAELVNPDKAIQYIATLAWNQNLLTNEPDRLITEQHYLRYYDVINKMGKVLDTVSKLSLNNSKDLLLSRPGKVFRILDQNFGLLEIEEGLVLFDTCDFHLNHGMSADKAGKGLDQVVNVGAKIMAHACLIDTNLKIPYLATSVWMADNYSFNGVSNYPAPIRKSDIHTQKIENFRIVVGSVSDTIEDRTAKHDPKSVVLWQMAKVKAVFLDRGYKEHGSMLCGLVQMSIGIGFFISKSFVKVDAIPNVGMDEYVNVFPCNRINPKNPQQFASIDFICTNLYPTYLNRQSAVAPDHKRLTEIIEESTEILLKVITKYPSIRNPMAFIG